MLTSNAQSARVRSFVLRWSTLSWVSREDREDREIEVLVGAFWSAEVGVEVWNGDVADY